jgi:hypothetical protein
VIQKLLHHQAGNESFLGRQEHRKKRNLVKIILETFLKTLKFDLAIKSWSYSHGLPWGLVTILFKQAIP